MRNRDFDDPHPHTEMVLTPFSAIKKKAWHPSRPTGLSGETGRGETSRTQSIACCRRGVFPDLGRGTFNHTNLTRPTRPAHIPAATACWGGKWW